MFKATAVIIGVSVLGLASMPAAAGMVKGYVKKDGTYVAPYVRSAPDSTPYNNYSYTAPKTYTAPTYTAPVNTPTQTYTAPSYSAPASTPVWVNGYMRADGTYVNGYWR